MTDTKQQDALQSYQGLLSMLKATLWGKEYVPDVGTDYDFIHSQCVAHTIVALPARQIDNFTNIDEQLVEQWKKEIYRNIYYYQKITHIQAEIILNLQKEGVRFVILKGSSVSCYYPNPILRTMGDIDIMPCQEDFEKASSILRNLCNNKRMIEINNERHIVYIYKGIAIELHRRFASFSDVEKTKYLDNLILTNITEKTMLDDEVNGLVILQHLNQHLETGIGLRQIIDWMYYVNSCLNDNCWDSCFIKHAKLLGLDTLAITVTKMCIIYLGLNAPITWCNKADNNMCKELLLYILKSGNLGTERKNNDDAVSNVIIQYKNLFDMLKEIQRNGRENWQVAQKYKILMPFAWLYQCLQFVKRAHERKVRGRNLLRGYLYSRSRRRLMQKLGAKDISLGTVKIINGQLVNDKQQH